MDESAGRGSQQGPIGRLLRSASELLATVLAIGRTRLELLSVELQLELRRIAVLAALGFAALFAGSIGLVMAGAAVIIVFWDTHRVLAALGVTAGFFAICLAAVVALVRQSRRGPRLLAGTLGELQRDVDNLRGRT